MRFDIRGNPDYGDLTVWLEQGESILAESGAMSRMTAVTEVKGRVPGGFLSAVARKFLGGESFFLGEYMPPVEGPAEGFVSLSPGVPGTVLHRALDGDSLLLTATSFLACTPGVDVRTRFGGLRAFFSREGMFVLECSGSGHLFFNAYGGVVERQVDGSFTVDNGHVVAWEPGLSYTIGGMGGLKQTLFSGEGLVMRFEGRGKLWLQSRHLGGVAGWLTPYLRP